MSERNQQHLMETVFAPWVEWREERCRGGRTLITAVNQRDGLATYLDPVDLDPQSGDRYQATMTDLRDGGFLDSAGPAPHAGRPAPAKPAGAGLVWHGADRFLRAAHEAGLRRAFDRFGIAAQIALAVLGVVAFVITLRTDGFELPARPMQVPAIIILGLIAVVIHELGHALVTVHYGRQVRMVGIRLHLGTPAFYVESVDALLLTRRQRLIQAAAGPWAEWLVTSAVALAFLALPHDAAGAAILHRFLIVNTIVIVSNLLPFVGLDGALLLADALGQPDLPHRAGNALLASPQSRRNLWFMTYATANAIVATALLVTAGFFWWQLFGALGTQLWALGAPGVLVILIAGAVMGHHVFEMIPTTFRSGGPRAAELWAKVAFRIERRWRIRAITAFRALPEICDLDESELGLLAGHLQRLRSCDGILSNLSDHVYVHRPPRGRSRASTQTCMVKGALAKIDLTRTDLPGGRASLIGLPEGWQRLLRQNGEPELIAP